MEYAISSLIPRSLSSRDSQSRNVERLYLLADLMEAADRVLLGAYVAPNVGIIDAACAGVDLGDMAKGLRVLADAWIEADEAAANAAELSTDPEHFTDHRVGFGGEVAA